MTGYGDLSYNARRGILGAISLEGKIAYHLYNINPWNTDDTVTLSRRTKWHSQYSTEFRNLVFDLHAKLPRISTRKQYFGHRFQSYWRDRSDYGSAWNIFDS